MCSRLQSYLKKFLEYLLIICTNHFILMSKFFLIVFLSNYLHTCTIDWLWRLGPICGDETRHTYCPVVCSTTLLLLSIVKICQWNICTWWGIQRVTVCAQSIQLGPWSKLEDICHCLIAASVMRTLRRLWASIISENDAHCKLAVL